YAKPLRICGRLSRFGEANPIGLDLDKRRSKFLKLVAYCYLLPLLDFYQNGDQSNCGFVDGRASFALTGRIDKPMNSLMDKSKIYPQANA
ncbi:hypothetical protein ACFGY9_10890, partial [Pasteurella multocida]